MEEESKIEDEPLNPNITVAAEFFRTFQSMGRSRRVIAQRPLGERYQPIILDHVSLIDPLPRDPAGNQYSERISDLLRNMFRNYFDENFERIETEEQKAEGRLKKINRNFFEKLKKRIKYTKDGITIDDQAIDNVGAATAIGNMIIATMNESIEVTDDVNQKINDFFKF